MAVSLDAPVAVERLTALHKELEKHPLDTQSFLVVAGKDDPDSPTTCVAQLHMWLFGYELPDTVLVVAGSNVHLLTSEKKSQFLQPLVQAVPDSAPFKLNILVRNKADGNKENFNTLIAAIKGQGDAVGVLMLKGKPIKPIGSFATSAVEAFKELKLVDVTAPVEYLIAPKDKKELTAMNQGGAWADYVMSKGVKRVIANIVESSEKKKAKHNQIAAGVEEFALSQKAVEKLKEKQCNLNQDQMDLAFDPIIQSGGTYKLKFSATSDQSYLKEGAIVSIFGVKYQNYCVAVGRTFLVDPTRQEKSDYSFLLRIHEFVCEALVPGADLGRVYADTMEKIKDEQPREELQSKFVSNIGFGTGLEFRTASLLLSPKSKGTKVKAGMTFVVALGFSDLEDEEKKGSNKKYAVFVADTVVVQKEGPVKFITNYKRKLGEIAMYWNEEAEEDNTDAAARVEELLKDSKVMTESRTRTGAFSDPKEAAKRKHHQAEITEQLRAQMLARLENAALAEKKQKKVEKVAYRQLSEVPLKECARLQIFIDKQRQAVFLPIYGICTPFHVSMIKNLSKSEEGDDHYLRINFNTPTQAQAALAAQNSDAKIIYLKEVVYRSHVSVGLDNALRLIKDLRKRYTQAEAQRAELADLVEQDDIILNRRGPAIRLTDLSMRPNLSTKKTAGSLECHNNGLRFTSRKNDKLDILFSNIKHAFFQPHKHEIMILLHFHLKNPILIGKKKHKDVQFYTEIGEVSTDLDKRRGGMDRDDFEEEVRERRLRKRLTEAFERFFKKVEETSESAGRGNKVEFEMPFYELGFEGVPFKSSCRLQPTTSCLINLTEWPAFVLDVGDVERVHFERVTFGNRNFDITFILRDYYKKPVQVWAVDTRQLESIKDWLDEQEIKFTEGRDNLNWPKVMKAVQADILDAKEARERGDEDLDPEDIVTKCWSFLDDTPDSDEEDDESSSEAYNPSDDDASEYSEEYESDEFIGTDDDSDSDSEESDGNESEGKDWDELEKEAARADRRKETTEDDDAPKKGKKRQPDKQKHKKSKKKGRF
eukprot:m.42392 g.42392  ORF g.42392 m.42392 type:complete len:1047 (+) comp11541_c0_seq1:166-3306(+)